MGVDFKDKVCIVTGSTSGIGLGEAEELLKRGAEVYVSGRKTYHMKEARELLAPYGDRAHFEYIDLEDRNEVEKYITRIGEVRGIDYVFPNAGYGTLNAFEDISWNMWDKIININFIHVIACIRAALPFMFEKGEGHFVITSSMAAYCYNPYQPHYVATKHAVYGLTQSLHYQYADDNITFQAVCPGYVDTRIFSCDDEPSNPVSIPVFEAIADIFAGIESGEVTINVGEQARNYYRNLTVAPEKCDAAMKNVAKMQREIVNPFRPARKAE